MNNNNSVDLQNSQDADSLQDLTKSTFRKPKKEVPFAFFGNLPEKQQDQFIARTADLFMQDPLFSDLSPKPLPSRDQIMHQLREYMTDGLKAK